MVSMHRDKEERSTNQGGSDERPNRPLDRPRESACCADIKEKQRGDEEWSGVTADNCEGGEFGAMVFEIPDNAAVAIGGLIGMKDLRAI